PPPDDALDPFVHLCDALSMAAKKKAAKKTAATTYLVGDVGGTRTRLALHQHGKRAPLAEAVLSSREHATFEEIALTFLARVKAAHPSAAVLGVAGPVHDRTATITNLPWKLDERALQKRLRIPRVLLANDLVVGARGCLEMGRGEVELLTAHAPAKKGQ